MSAKRFFVLALTVVLSACLLDSDDKDRGSETGYVRLNVQLEKPANVLSKRFGSDTLFYLDTIKVILTAPGAATQSYSYAIQGRPDTGAILVGTGLYALSPLRKWKAKIFTIDTTLNPTRTDTVHMDSVELNVTPADTVIVNKVIASAYAVLRVRLLSTTGDSLLASVRYLRVKINGVTRDSIFPSGATYNGVYYANLATAWAVSDSGWIYKTSDSGTTWIPQLSGISSNLNSAWFTSTANGCIVGDNGAVLRTTNGGANWIPKTSGTTQNLRKVVFGTPARAYAVGDGGVILKSIDSGNTWTSIGGGWFSQTSPNSANVHSAFFTSPTAGWAAGASGNILRTTNSGANWTAQQYGNKNWRDIHLIGTTGYAVGDSGKILKTTDGAAWTSQTSPTTEDQYGVDMSSATVAWSVGSDETILKTTDGTNWFHQTGGWFSAKTGITGHINSVNMGTGTTGWAVGDGGFITKSTDGGVSWTPQSSPTVEDLNTVFVWNQNSATAVGQNGKLIKTNFNGTAWSDRTSNTNNHLRDLDMDTVTRGWAVGDNETISQTTDSINWVTKPGFWTEESSGVSDTLNAIRFFNGYSGWAVGAAGKVTRTTNGGDSWIPVTTGRDSAFRGVHPTSATNVVIVGDSGYVFRTTNTGGSWSKIDISTTAKQRAVYFSTATVGWVVGESGGLRRSQNGGSSWSNQTLSPANGTAVFRGVHSNNTYVRVVGDAGVMYYKTSTGSGTYNSVSSGTAAQLNGVYVINNSVAVAVGQGGVITRTTNGTSSGGTWATVSSPTGANLRGVWFRGTTGSTDTGYAVGDGGVLLESTNSGASWTVLPSGTTRNLNDVYVRPGSADSAIFAGSNGHIARTINGGISWTGQATLKHFNGVDFVSATTGWLVTSDGRVLKTSNGGTRWVLQDNNASTPLNGIYFRNSTVGWVVGNGGVIRKTTDGGSSWNPQGSGFGSYNLTRIHFRATSDTGWITGEAGVLLRTTNGGTLWTKEVVSTGQALRGVFVRTRDSVLVAGDSGNIFKTNNSGVSFRKKATRVDLKGVYFVPSTSTAFAVGTLGTILKTTNSGTTWDSLPSGLATTLNAVMFPTDVNTGYAVGAAGKILKTTNGGTSWSPSTVGSEEFTRVHFANANLGWAVAKTGKIYRTVNAGGAWVLQTSGTGQDLAGVFATNTDSVFAVGATGTILKTRDSGVVKTSVDLKGAHFIGDTGFVVGVGGLSMRTTNGGNSWTTLTGASQTLNSVFFSRQSGATGYVFAAGDGGTLMQATLSSNWTSKNSGTTQKINAVHVAGAPRLYLVADSGIIRTFSIQSNPLPLPASPTWVIQPTQTTESLRDVNCFPSQDTCLFVGTNETVVKTDDGASAVYVFKSSGARRFDKVLTYKYLQTQKPNIILLQAIDRPSPLRGFEFADTLTLGAGQDSTLNVELKRCGGTAPACTP